MHVVRPADSPWFKAFYDDNGITIDGHTDLSFTEDVGKRFEGYGWQVGTHERMLERLQPKPPGPGSLRGQY